MDFFEIRTKVGGGASIEGCTVSHILLKIRPAKLL